MKKPDKKKKPELDRVPDILLNPEERLCPGFDAVSINHETLATSQDMGFRVLDNCTEEHEM